MIIKKITVNGNEYEFVNSSRNTRNGFAHDTTLFRNNYKIAENSCHYINRTWEYYKYQTVMQVCINNLITETKEQFINNYKYINNIKRLTAEKRETAEKEFYELADIKELQEVYKQLDYNN